MKKVLLFLLSFLMSSMSFSQTDVVVDPNAKYQTFKGFGVSLAWWANVIGGWDQATIDDVCTSLTSSSELNMNYFRFNIPGGDTASHAHMRVDAQMGGYKTSRTGSYDWTADANQRRILEKIYSLKSSAIYEAIAYSPPYWMTHSRCSSGEANGGSNLLAADYTTFADYLTEVVKHYKDSVGVTFSMLTPMNEPFSNWWKANGQQEGCYFSQANQETLINAVYDKLTSKNMLTYCKISAMDANSINEAHNGLNGYISSGVISKVHDISTHSYTGTAHAQLYNAAKAQGKDVWQTETGPLWVNETGIDNYLVMANRIIDDLKNMKVVAWADWQAMSNEDHWGFWRYDASNHTYVKLKSYYVRKQFSKYLKPGYTIVNSSANTIAALNPDNNELVIVLINRNTTNSVSHKVHLNLFSSAGPSAATYRTSPAEDCVQLSSVSLANNIFNYTAPARSITTFVIPVTLAAAAPIANGNFRITAKHSNKDMSVNGWSENDGAVIEQWAPLGQANQVFNVQWTSSGYKLLPSYNAKAVAVNGSNAANGAVVDQWADGEQGNQRFSIIDAGGGYYKIVARHSGKCLAVNNTGMNNGDDVVQWEWLNYDNFKWQFTSVPLTSSIADGTYTIKARHSSKVMSVEGWSSSNGSIVEQWTNLCQGNQKFTVQFSSTGYIIKPSYNTKAVSVNNYSAANGAAVVQWDDLSQTHQRFEIVNLGAGYYKIVPRHSNKCLAVIGSGTNNGDDVVQWEWQDSDNFKWSFETPCAGGRQRTTDLGSTEEGEENTDLKIYPNPATDHFFVQASGMDNSQITMYDTHGKVVMSKTEVSDQHPINVDAVSGGIYILKVSGVNRTIYRKILIR